MAAPSIPVPRWRRLVCLSQDGGSHNSCFRTACRERMRKVPGLVFPIKMAASMSQRLRPQLIKIMFTSRNLHCSPARRAGGKWRMQNGLPVDPSAFGPMTDLPDWSFADGRPAPPMKGQLERQEKNKEFARRVAMISAEMDRGIERWEAQQREVKQQAEEKKSKRLQPKGRLFQECPK